MQRERRGSLSMSCTPPGQDSLKGAQSQIIRDSHFIPPWPQLPEARLLRDGEDGTQLLSCTRW